MKGQHHKRRLARRAARFAEKEMRDPGFVPKKKCRPKRQRPEFPTAGDFDRAAVNRRRKLALASKRRNRA